MSPNGTAGTGPERGALGRARAPRARRITAYDNPPGMATTMFTSRLPDATMRAIEARANKRGMTKTEALTSLVEDALDMRGREGLEARVAAMQATIDEQERIIAKQTGKPTPRTKRLSVGLTLAEAGEVDRAAREAGLTRSEYLRRRILPGGGGARQALPGGGDGGGKPPKALPAPPQPAPEPAERGRREATRRRQGPASV